MHNAYLLLGARLISKAFYFYMPSQAYRKSTSFPGALVIAVVIVVVVVVAAAAAVYCHYHRHHHHGIIV